jgi:predicted DNA-binding antitoxin AbrB/MazE fold protein
MIDMIGESIRALYKDGVFVPQEHVSLDDGSTVELVFRPSTLQLPLVNDPGERRKFMDELIASFKRNPIPVGTRQFTRDEVHERA